MTTSPDDRCACGKEPNVGQLAFSERIRLMDRATLRQFAVQTLRKQVPDELSWFPWGDLPPVHCLGSDEPIERLVLRGLLVHAHLLGRVSASEPLRALATVAEPLASAGLAAWLLDVWMVHDTEVPEVSEERLKSLREIAEHGAAMAQRWGRSGTDAEARYQALMELESNPPTPSAMPFVGLLSLVAVGGDFQSVKRSKEYLTRWHPERQEQCVALLEMLVLMKDPAVEEVLVASGKLPGLGEPARKALEAWRSEGHGGS